MSNSFKYSLITGANRGIGLEFVRQLLVRGGHVFAGVRNPDQASDLQQLATEYPKTLSILALETRNADHLQVAVQRVQDLTGELNLLVNNAGILPSGESIGELNADQMLETLHVNSVAPTLIVQAFRGLLKAGKPAVIVNMSSGLASLTDTTTASSPSYRASKAAQNMFTRVLANGLSADGVIVVAMDPGWVKTDMGGTGAQLEIEYSVSRQLSVIDQLSPDDAGRFLLWDGSQVPW